MFKSPRQRGALLILIAAAAILGWWIGSKNSEPQIKDGMVLIKAGELRMGSNLSHPEEAPEFAQRVESFWIDRTEVTNAQFAAFVAATGYRSLAERGIALSDDPAAPRRMGSAVFSADQGVGWRFVEGATWRSPQGPGSNIEGKDEHPVVHVAFEDALAYARWKGHQLPTEAQWEWAAQAARHQDARGHYLANTWQGSFPMRNEGLDGHLGTAPVAQFPADLRGLFDMVGNVWEWTDSAYYPSHDFAERERFPEGHDPAQPGDAVAVLKGGSHLCAPNYCARYRPEARIGQSRGLGASHIGFRTIKSR
jgi:formylglycine-generating enzyme